MGNDGGTIATQRSYVRGARLNHNDATKKASADTAEGREEVLNTCALTGAKLNHGVDAIVACPYGRLYLKEAVIQALLRRARAAFDSQQQIGQHIRGLKDLYDVKLSPGSVCPITGQNLISGSIACFLIASKRSKELSTNVLSEKGVKQMGINSLQDEYGPFEETDLIYLAPNSEQLKDIQANLDIKRSQKKKNKVEKTKRKIKNNGEGTIPNVDSADLPAMKNAKVSKKDNQSSCSKILGGVKVAPDVTNPKSAVSIARASVASAVAKDSVLSSLFVKDNSKLTDKEKRDKLFATNGR